MERCIVEDYYEGAIMGSSDWFAVACIVIGSALSIAAGYRLFRLIAGWRTRRRGNRIVKTAARVILGAIGDGSLPDRTVVEAITRSIKREHGAKHTIAVTLSDVYDELARELVANPAYEPARRKTLLEEIASGSDNAQPLSSDAPPRRPADAVLFLIGFVAVAIAQLFALVAVVSGCGYLSWFEEIHVLFVFFTGAVLYVATVWLHSWGFLLSRLVSRICKQA